MKSMYKPNISATEKWVSTVTGAALAIAGYTRSNRALGLTGLGLVARGVSGYCPVNAAMGRSTSKDTRDTREALSGPKGVIVDASITIYRPAQEVYAYWRQFDNLPRFMSHLLAAEDLGDGRSRWTAEGPLGVPVSWEAEIINDVPPTSIAWSTVGDSDVVSAGSVRFKPAGGDHGTEVHVRLQYDPPAGKVGATVAWLLGADAQTEIEDDLRRFKQLLETGEIATGKRYGARSDKRARRDQEAAQQMTEPIPVR
jgi:uncharacterized membrane protein